MINVIQSCGDVGREGKRGKVCKGAGEFSEVIRVLKDTES